MGDLFNLQGGLKRPINCKDETTKSPLEFAVAERLRAAVQEFYSEICRKLGALIGVTNASAGNWANALNLPRVP